MARVQPTPQYDLLQSLKDYKSLAMRIRIKNDPQTKNPSWRILVCRVVLESF